MQEVQVGEMKSAAEIKGTPAPFQSAVADIKAPTAQEEAQMRELLGKVTKDGLDDMVATPAPTEQPIPPTQPTEVPAKFKKPDGTVDEEKLKASSENIGKAIEQKQKSIDEMLAEYKEKEKQFTELGQKAKQLKETPPNPTPEPQTVPEAINQNLPPEQVRQQLLKLQQDDPIAFAVEIARVVARREATEVALPALRVTEQMAEQQKDSQMRSNLLALAEKDQRVQDPALYAELINELKSDPAYFRLKNPLKSAWNEVKERLRLGEPQAQPSNPQGPILGRGVPPSVSSLAQPVTARNLGDGVSSVNPFSEEGKAFEAQMKALAEQTWRG